MKSLTIRICVLSMSLLMGCTEDLIQKRTTDDGEAWQPCIELEKGDGQAILHISNPLPSISYAGTPPPDPDYFNIWISQALEAEFTLYQKVGIRTTSVTLEGLQNGRPLYAFITSHRGNATDSTGVVMTIPSETDLQVFSVGEDSPFEHFAASVDLNFVSFIRASHLYVKRKSDALPILAEKAIMPSWSSSSNQIVYIATRDENNFRYPSSIKIFDAPQGKTIHVFDIDYHDYYIQSPSFIPDGSEIMFLSSEGNPDKTFYDIWTWNQVTGKKHRLTDFSKADFVIDRGYSRGKNGTELYVSGSHGRNSVANLYKLDLTSGSITPVMVSSWNDRAPSLSPDNSRLAFISDRTGRDELWVLDLEDASLVQLTGAGYTFDSRYSDLNWLDNDHLLLTVYNGQSSIAVTVKSD